MAVPNDVADPAPRAERHAVQPGILALGSRAHTYLELDRTPGTSAHDLVVALAGVDAQLSPPHTVNLVVGVRPELWAEAVPGAAPPDAAGFDTPVVGPDGFAMPASQHDVWIWLAGGARDAVFDTTIEVLAVLAPVAGCASEVDAWIYHDDLDLTGFQDGTENPPLHEAVSLMTIPDGMPGSGSSVVLVQQWEHRAREWSELTQPQQEQVMGRTKPDSVELDPRPESSHVARTDQDTFGDILRRNTAYGTAVGHGTMFVGFAARRQILADMLDSMAGVGGVRDALTRFAIPRTGGYYVVPSATELAGLA